MFQCLAKSNHFRSMIVGLALLNAVKGLCVCYGEEVVR